MQSSIIQPTSIQEIENQAFKNGFLIPLPSFFYKQFTRNQIEYFCWKHGIYVVPTTELITFLDKNIQGSGIEIGCGHGAIGRALNIPTTDSKLQDDDQIRQFYKATNQPTIKYPVDIIELDAIDAIKKYQPDTVIGGFITHKYSPRTKTGNMYGVVEGKILKSVEKYIHVGNRITHQDKPILKHKHKKHYFDWLITRSQDQEQNRIYIWDKL